MGHRVHFVETETEVRIEGLHKYALLFSGECKCIQPTQPVACVVFSVFSTSKVLVVIQLEREWRKEKVDCNRGACGHYEQAYCKNMKRPCN